MAEDNQPKQKTLDEYSRPSTPAESVNYFAKIAAEKTSNKKELISHLQSIFNEARQDRRGYRTLRNSFFGAAGALGATHGNIFNNIQDSFDVAFSMTILTLLVIGSGAATRLYGIRMAYAIETGRMAQIRTKEVVDSKKDFFEGSYFVTYLELYREATNKIKELKKNPEKFHDTEDDTKVRSGESKFISTTLAVFFGALYLTVLFQWLHPRESQNIVGKKSEDQHISINKLTKNIFRYNLGPENPFEPSHDIKRMINEKINKKTDYPAPEQFP